MNAPFTDWRKSGKRPAAAPYNRNSPNLLVILEASKSIGGTMLGSFVNRAVRGGSSPSIHSWGAAIDIGIKDENVRRHFMEWLIAFSDQLHVQEVHDYAGVRAGANGEGAYWRSDRNPGWKAAKHPSADPAMHKRSTTWVHAETNLDGWDDRRSLAERGVPMPGDWQPGSQPAPQAMTSGELDDLALVAHYVELGGQNLELLPKLAPGMAIDDDAKRNAVRYLTISLKTVGNQPDCPVTGDYNADIVARVAAFQGGIKAFIDPNFPEADGNVGIMTWGLLGYFWKAGK